MHNSLSGQGAQGVPGWGPLEDTEWRQKLAHPPSPENCCTPLSSSETTEVGAAV